MKLRTLLPALPLAGLLAAVTAFAADRTVRPEFTSTGVKPVVYDARTKEMIASGGGKLVYGEVILTADDLRYSQPTETVTAKGNVVLTRGDLRLVADEGTYSTKDSTVHLINPRAGRYPMYISGRELTGTTDEFTLTDATLAYGEPGTFRPTVKAKSVTLRTNDKYEAKGAVFNLGRLPVMALPHFGQKLGDAPFTTSVSLGYRSSLGPYVELTGLLPLEEGVRVGADLGLFGKRGVLVGPAAKYDVKSATGRTTGELRTGWIHDFGERDTDKFGRPIDADRGFIEWQHRQTSGEHFDVTAQFNYWSDSDVMRDFRRHSFTNVQEPDSFLDANYTGANWALNAFARVNPNDFEVIQQREPELRADLFPTPVGGGVLQRGSASFVRLREHFPVSDFVQESQRFDVFYGLSRPWAAAPWLTLTPVAGGRMTHYFDPLGAKDSYTRWVGELGADARMRAYGTFEVKNETWEIDGLRHLVEPFAQYRWLPGADRGTAFIPQVDREVFGTRLQPLELGDLRHLDTLHERNTLRLGLDQRLQTRDKNGGNRDLISLVLAQDIRFTKASGEDADSDLNADLQLAPAPWVSFDFFQRFALDDHQMKEFDSGITFRDGEYWSVRFGTQFLRGDLEEYDLGARMRLNEKFALLGRWRYDARVDSLYEQSYGLRQNFGRLWSVEYQLAWLEGMRRESKFHLRVVLDIVSF